MDGNTTNEIQNVVKGGTSFEMTMALNIFNIDDIEKVSN